MEGALNAKGQWEKLDHASNLLQKQLGKIRNVKILHLRELQEPETSSR